MSEIVCPNCNQPQKLSKNNLCSYCYAKLFVEQDNSKSSEPITENQSNRQNQRKDKKRQKRTISKLSFIVISIVAIILSFISFAIHGKHFPWSIKSQVSTTFMIISSILGTIILYSLLNTRFDMDDFVKNNFGYSKNGRELSDTESYLYFFITTIFLCGVLNFMIIPMINDISSVFSETRTHKVFLNNKNYHKGSRGGATYYANFTNWTRSNENNITLVITKNEWDKLIPEHSYQIKVKKGIFTDSIWSLKPE